MSSAQANAQWGASYRLIAADKWKAQSAAMGRAATDALVEYCRAEPGMQVLDLAAGTGEPGISLAHRVGATGHVTALDQSQELLDIAADRATHRGLTNFSTKKADAHALPFPENTFDLAACRFGVMFFADAPKALRELNRVLKPGARACFLAWGPLEVQRYFTPFTILAKHVGGPVIPPGAQDPFRFAEPGSLSAQLRNAGFGPVEEHTRTVAWAWPGTVEQVWEYLRSVTAPFRPLMERVPADQWDEISKEIYTALGKYVEGDQVNFGATLVFASGMKS
jgi:SAM-dependent methyltransferase